MRILRIPVAVTLAILAFGGLLAILCIIMLWQEDRQFDSALSKVTLGMSEADVVRLMGKPHHVFSSEADLDTHQRSLREWFATFDRPIRVTDTVLEFTGYERQAYIYFNKERHVEAVVVARRGQNDRFKLIRLSPDSGKP